MSDKMREALERLIDLCAEDALWPHAARAAREALAEQPALGEAVKPSQYVIQYNDDGEFGQATGWLYRDGGYPCVVTGKPVYVWRPLRDLIGKPPAVPDGWKLVPTRSTPEWIETLTERGLKVGSLAGLIEGVLAAAPEVPRG